MCRRYTRGNPLSFSPTFAGVTRIHSKKTAKINATPFYMISVIS